MIDWRQWGHEPLFLSALLALACATALIRGPWRDRFTAVPQLAPVAAGLALAYLAVGPPWEQAGRYYLFSVQMAEQLALVYGSAALLVMGLSPVCWKGERGAEPAARGSRPLIRGSVASIGCGALYVLGTGMWYLPRIQERALGSEAGLAVEHLCLLALGMVFWWPVLSRNRRWPALRFAPRMLYLLVVEVALAGAFTYFLMAEHAIYPTFEIAPRLVARLPPEEDQVLAGVLLSGIGSIVLVSALGAAFFAWAKESERATSGRGRSTPARR
jgi:putative membrane protein